VVVRRLAGLRAVFAAPVDAFALERLAVGLRAPDVRLAPDVADLARVEPLERFAVERLAVERFAVDLRAAGLRFAAVFFAGFDALLVPVEAAADPSIDHLPDITRCAASATASAMIEPNLVALDMTLLAACDAVSAASSPASRIFLRAAGLALIAAAAAARPAASISLLIAALASLSIVSLDLARDADEPELEREREDVDREELLRADFAIFFLPPSRKKTL
jgi:hypothetical protein